MSPVSLKPFAERLIATFHRNAQEANVDLHLAVDDGEVLTDARLLEMIAANVISNAIRYTPSGGSVQFDLHHDDNGLLVLVRDTGVGIPPEHQKRIFERLYRVDSTRDRATGGSGLGLAIVYRAVQTLGGHIQLDSTPGQGSEFRITIPAGSSAAQPAADTPQVPTRLQS